MLSFGYIICSAVLTPAVTGFVGQLFYINAAFPVIVLRAVAKGKQFAYMLTERIGR